MKETNMSKTVDYLRETFEINPATNPHAFVGCLDAMERYEDPWWFNENDERVLAHWQIDEPRLLIPWRTFKRGVEKVLGRSLDDEELHSGNVELIRQFHEAYQKIDF